MTIRLRIVSDHRRLLGERSSISFSVDGGTIGRSADNDWVLPDPLRYVSAHHARVEYRDGHYYLEDVSTNGVFVNDDDRPLAKALPGGHLLKSGDVVRMGDYHIVASIEGEGDGAPRAHPDTGAGQVPTSINALRTLGRAAAQTDIGAMLNLDDLLVPDNSQNEVLHPVNAYGQAIAHLPTAPARVFAAAQHVAGPAQAGVHGNGASPGYGAPSGHGLGNGAAPGNGATPGYGATPGNGANPGYGGPPGYGASSANGATPGNAAAAAHPATPGYTPGAPLSGEDEAIDRRIARLARAAARDPKNGISGPALYDVHSGLQAFCRGAGVEVERLPPDAQTRMLHLAGQLFREALVGLKELDRSRGDTRNRYRIELPVEPDDPRPSLARAAVEDLIIELFSQHESRRLDAIGWLREAIAEGKNHENASARATRAAFVEFLDRLDPAELEARFERAARRGKARSADKAQYWELFTTFYRNLIEMPADHLPHTFVEAFAAAYREYVKKPAP
jgi:type VI secretion system protein